MCLNFCMGFHNMHQSYTDSGYHGNQENSGIHTDALVVVHTSLHLNRVMCSMHRIWQEFHDSLDLRLKQNLI